MICFNEAEGAVDRAFQLFRLEERWKFPATFDGKIIRVDVEWVQRGYVNTYKVNVGYRVGDGKVLALLLSPIIKPSPLIHLNSDRTLCLFDPHDYQIEKRFVLADEIIPWVLEWTLFYELFLQTGVWHGAEAA